MNIVFVTLYNPRDINRGSGTYYYMTQEMERQGHNLLYLGPLVIDDPFGTKLFRFFSKKFLKKRYRSYQDPFNGRVLGKAVTQALQGLDYDVLITNDYAIAGYTRTDKPVVIRTDAIFPRNYSENTHPWLADLSWFSVLFCQAVTRQGMQRAAMCCYPTEWAAEEAKKYQILSDAQITVVPYGANIADPGKEIAVGRSFTRILAKDQIDLLFVGKDWALKGGDIAIAVVEALQNRGIRACLHVVGTTPPQVVDENLVKVYGYLDKGNLADRVVLDQLYRNCDALLLPSIAEGFGIVYVEAAAFGLPSLVYKTTGVTNAIKDGISGRLLEILKSPADFAQIIMSWYVSPNLYNQLVQGAREHFEKEGNWSVSVSKLIAEIQRNVVL